VPLGETPTFPIEEEVLRKLSWRKLAAGLAVGALVAGPLALVSEAQTPTFYPSGFTLDSTSYSLRLAGGNRYATAGTLAVTADVNDGGSSGAFPFGNPDDTDPSEAYSTGSCPDAVGIAAGDTPADALAASSAWETNLDAVPVAGGGSQDNVSTTDSVMLLTQSAREGGQSADLSPETIQAIQKIRNECGSFNSMVFGGSAAIPATALSTLDALTDTVYQFAGTDRFDTARQIGRSVFLGDGGLPDVTHYPSATATSVNLTDAVFLAEGMTGADALAIGPFAADNNVPVLLTTSTGLPQPTRNALIELAPSNIIVLGGTSAISAETATAAAAAAGSATVTRIAGTDRYLSSIAIAEQLFDMYTADAVASGSGTGAFSDQGIGFARSEGSGANHVGWPDALSSAWWLAMQDNESSNPERLAPPVEKNQTGTTIGGSTDEQPPLLLTGQGALPASVASYLSGLYPDATNMVTATNPGGGDDGGFGFVFGGTSAIAQNQVLDIAQRLSGGTYVTANRSDLAPTMAAGQVFYTALDYTGYTPADETVGGPTGVTAAGDKVCGYRNAFTGSQFLSQHEADGLFVSGQSIDYQNSGSGFPAFQSRFTCDDRPAAGDAGDDTTSVVKGLSSTGHSSGSKTLSWTGAATQLGSTVDGADAAANTAVSTPSGCDVFTDTTVNASTCSTTFTFTGAMPVTYKGSSYALSAYSLSLTVTRTDGAAAGDGTDAITATGTLTVTDGATTLFTATLTGESATLASPLAIAGFYSQSGALGGFHLTLTAPTATAALSDLALQGNAA
jgi:ell wall binding domain 2 (CWB2)